MKTGRNLWIDLLLALGAGGLALFIGVLIQTPRYTILSHEFGLGFGAVILVLLLWAGFFALMFSGTRLLARREARAFGLDFEDRLKKNALATVPCVFLILSPTLGAQYWTREDLRGRLGLLALFVILAALYLKLADVLPLIKGRSTAMKAWRARIEGLTLKKKLVFLFVGAFLIYNLCTFILVSRGVTFSGDEPNYLLISHSLIHDRDINLANNFANKDYFAFYSKEDNPKLNLGIYGRYGKKGKDYVYPINLPGISVLMLPWYWAGRFFSGKWLTFILKGSLSVWAALLGLQVYLLVRDLWRKETPAFIVWLIFSFSTPVLFYAVHLYPEIPIALFSISIFRKVRSPAPLSTFALLFMGFLLGTFFWFGVKYNFIFWPLLAVSVYFLWTQHQARVRILLFLILPFLGTILFYAAVYHMYGTVSPFAVYEGVMSEGRSQALKEALLGIPLRARIETLLDYFLDQRDGLLLYSPFYFFMFIGAVELYRKARKELVVLALIGLPFVLNYAFFTHRQGFCPQARVLAPLSWIGAVLIGAFLVHNRSRVFSGAFSLCAALGIAVSAVLLFHPSFLYQPTTHEFTQRPGDLFVFLSSLNIFLPPLLPSFLKIDNSGYLPDYLWTAALVLFIVLYVVLAKTRPGRSREGSRLGLTVVLLAVAFALWVYYPRTVLYPSRTFVYSSQKTIGYYPFATGRNVVAKNEGEMYLHEERTYRFVFSSRKKIEKLKLVFGSEEGLEDIAMRFFDLPLIESSTAREKKELVLAPPACVPFRKLFLYEIDFGFAKKSQENLKVNPYLFQIIPVQ